MTQAWLIQRTGKKYSTVIAADDERSLQRRTKTVLKENIFFLKSAAIFFVDIF
jgi:hypothetical protein